MLCLSGNNSAWVDALLDAFPLSVYVVDRNLRVVAWNAPRALGPQGIARGDAVGRSLEEVLPPDGFGTARRAILDVFETGRPGEETVMTLPHRQSYRCRRLPVRQQGEVTHVLSVFEEVTERERAEAALRESEAKYRLLFEGNPQPMWVYDVETLAFLAVNDAAVEHYGYSREEFLRLTIAHIRPAEDLPRLRDAVRDLPLVRRAARWRHRKKSGELIDVEVSSHGIEFCGRPARLVLATDVTERVRAEAALRQSEQRLQGAQRLACVGSWEWDVRTGEVAWSQQLREIHGIDAEIEAPLGALFWQQVHPDDRARVEALGRKAIEDRAPFAYDYRIVRPDGAVRTLQTRGHALVDEDGRVCRLVGADQDVTELKATESALWKRTEQLQAITDAMLTFLTTHSVREASAPLLQAALRHTRSEYGFIGVLVEGPVLRVVAHEGVRWHDALNREFYEQAVKTYRDRGYLEFKSFDNLFGRVLTSGRAVLSNEPSSDPRSGGLPAGHPPLRAFLGVPILGNGGAVVGMIGVANRPGGYSGDEAAEIEVLTRATGVLFGSHLHAEREAELEEQLRQSQRMEAMGRLAGGVAHDFNNLLGIITGYSDLLLREGRADEAQARRLEQIRRAGERAAALTRQLLAFSRKQVLQQKPLDLNTLAADMEKMLRRLIGEHIELVAAFDPELGRVKGDPGQLEQVLMNLAVNARDAMPGGGTLRIETSNAALPVPGAAEGGRGGERPWVCLSVSDTGCGMDAGTRRRIFEPFFTTKEPGKGTGLGLATVYGIVKQSGGHIEVESAPGRGSTFRVFLPRHEDGDVQAEEPGTTAAVRHERPATILLVEDDDALRAALADILEGDGHAVVQASNALEALAVVQTEPAKIELVLTDLVMPKMSGRSLAEKLDGQGLRIPVLYMSGYIDEALRLDGPMSDQFLQKPFPPEVLLQRVQQALRSR